MSDIPLFNIYQGTADAFRAKKDIKESEGLIAGFQAQEQEALGRRKYGVGQAWNQYLAASKQDKAADLERQAAQQQQASALGALQAGGAKALLGGLQGTMAQSAKTMGDIEAASQQRQQSALSQFAGVQQGAMNANVGLAADDVTRAQNLLDAETMRKRALIQQKRAGVDQAVSGGMDIASDVYGGTNFGGYLFGKHGMKLFGGGGTNEIKDIRKEFKSGDSKGEVTSRANQTTTLSRDAIRNKYSGAQKRLLMAQNRRDKRDAIRKKRAEIAPEVMENRRNYARALMDASFSSPTQEEFQQKAKHPDAYDINQTYASILGRGRANSLAGARDYVQETGPRPSFLGNRPTFNVGGVQKTPGEFSHAKNPIDIMKDGAKIGEMTGGEYIFNPRQSSTLQSLASKGSSPLHRYVRNLLQEFDRR